MEHTTQEYSTLAASEGAALSWARNLFNSLDTAMKEIYDQDIPPLQTVHQAMSLFLAQGRNVVLGIERKILLTCSFRGHN